MQFCTKQKQKTKQSRQRDRKTFFQTITEINKQLMRFLSCLSSLESSELDPIPALVEVHSGLVSSQSLANYTQTTIHIQKYGNGRLQNRKTHVCFGLREEGKKMGIFLGGKIGGLR